MNTRGERKYRAARTGKLYWTVLAALAVTAVIGAVVTSTFGFKSSATVQGRVPADLVQKLMTEHPADIRGIATPGR
ncbi:MAG: hypothetical protein GTO41_23675 [Burkholderiales bacterium]|nr:hypothetical protein [Burkholderiales bacterium]